MSQQVLFTVFCNRTRPAPATAVAEFIGIDDVSTQRWLCKGQSQNPWVPATEWLCARLASACGLPVPPVAVIEAAGYPGQWFFGSQWQGGAIEYLQARGRISNPGIFAPTHAVDLFVHNTDRHRGNFLYLELADEVVARVIDFSHALLVEGWPLPALPLDADCNTSREWPVLLQECAHTGYIKPTHVVEQISALSNDWLFECLAEMPEQWLPDDLLLKLACWWVGDGRHRRVRAAESALP